MKGEVDEYNVEVREGLPPLTVHAARDLTRLLVAPADGREVGLVVHEAAVEERLHVWVRGLDVNLYSCLSIPRDPA